LKVFTLSDAAALQFAPFVIAHAAALLLTFKTLV